MSGSIMSSKPNTQVHGDGFDHIPGIKTMLDEEGLNAPQTGVAGPVYKKITGSKIPVSKAMGKLWQGRLQAGRAARKRFEEQWDEAIQYYNADQSDHRVSNGGHTSGNKRKARRKSESYSSTENVIFSAIKALLPAIYARNPTAEFTATNTESDQDKGWCQCLETLCDTLASMKSAPGINLKYKVKQAIVCAKLINLAWVEVGYTIKEESSDQALLDLQRLSAELDNADTQKKILEIEGQLMALEEKINTLTPAGPYTRFYSGKDVTVDPEAMEPDYADAKWMAVEDYYPTAYLNAVYGEKQPDGTIKSIYEPTAVLLANSGAGSDSDSDSTNFKLFDTNEAAHYGYKDTGAYKAAQRTKCVRFYDKVTRRILIYADNKWDWPIWVEDDKLELPNFFPFEPLLFNVAPQGPLASSEVAYVLDQQDNINEINDTERRARFDLQYKVFFNQNLGVDRATVERVLKGASPVAEPVKVPEGMKMDELFYTPQPNILKAPQLFDVQRQKQVIDGIMGVTPSLRASEYKTNTTNKAIEQYNQSTGSRLDEQTDEIEEFLGRIFYNTAYLCARFMDPGEVALLVGEALAQNWRRVDDPKELKRMFSMRVVGGSTVKPTSQFKQQIAVQIAQVLGQFANAAPGTITRIVLSMFEQAYDEVGISEKDWMDLKAEVAAKLGIEQQKAQSPPQGPPQGQLGGAPAGPVEPTGGNMTEVATLIDQLPPEAKIALGQAMAKGVPIGEALPQIIQLVSQQQIPSQPQ